MGTPTFLVVSLEKMEIVVYWLWKAIAIHLNLVVLMNLNLILFLWVKLINWFYNMTINICHLVGIARKLCYVMHQLVLNTSFLVINGLIALKVMAKSHVNCILVNRPNRCLPPTKSPLPHRIVITPALMPMCL